MQPSAIRGENGKQLKGTKFRGKEILVYVCSLTNENDEALARNLLDNIVYIGK
jgi:hypothetical protein